MPGESLNFPIFAEDRASSKFREVGNSAAVAAGKIDIAAASLKLWDDTSVKSSKATDTLIASKLAVAKADVALAKAEGLVTSEAEKASKLLSGGGSGGGGVIDKLLALLTPGAGGAGGLGAAAAGAGGAAVVGPLLIGLSQVVGALAAAGAGVGAFAALSIPQFHAVSQSLQQINTDTQAYERATTKASKATALKRIRQDWADMSGPQRDAVHGIQSLQSEFGKLSAKLAPVTFKVFDEGLKIANQLLPVFLPFAQTAGKAIDGLLKSLDKFVTPAAGSGLTGKMATLFKAPPTGFQQFIAQLQALSGPAITALGKGIGQIAGAVGKLIIVSASPDSIRTLTRVLGFLAAVINGVTWAVNRASGNMQKWVDIAHQTANKFDEFRHDTAVVFAAVARAFDTTRHSIAVFGHDVAVIFDTLRHDIAHAWDVIWNDTVGQVQRGVTDVNKWFDRLPGMILGALRGLGHSLYAFAHSALDEFLSGLKSVGGTIFSWLKNFIGGIPHAIMSFLHMSPPHTGSVFFDLGANIMHHLEAGIKSTAHRAVNAAAGVAHRVASAGSGVQRWAGLVSQALRMEGLSPGLLGNVLYQMSTESGGNPNAINLNDINARMGDPSRGLMQTIMSTFQTYHWPGTSTNIYDPLANIAAALNYARHVYGPSLMRNGMGIGSGHGYDTGGWLPTGLSLALNNTGRPERVLGPGEGAGTVINVHVHAPVGANMAETGRQLATALGEYKKRGGFIYKPGGF